MTDQQNISSILTMNEPSTFLLPKPDFGKKSKMESKPPIYLTPSGMSLLPREKQPPPMYGPKGSTIPPRFLAQPKNIEEKPEERHFCEPCEMELQSLNDYRRHRAQHENCPIENCSFRAHSSVMDKHVMELHNSGIFEKIKKTSTPEEIAAWREERRRKYPTVANNEMRKLAQEQRERRGERLERNKSRFGRQEDRKRARNVEVIKNQRQKKPRQNQHRIDRRNTGKEICVAKKVVEEEERIYIKANVQLDVTSPCGMRLFAGTSKMKDYQHEKEKKSQKTNVLSSMLGMYGSDDDDDDDDDDNEEEETNKSFDKEILDESNSNDCKNDHAQTIELGAEISNQESLGIESENKPGNLIQCNVPTEMPSELEPLVKDISNVGKELASQSIHEDKSTQDSSDEAPDEVPIEHSDSVTSAITTLSTSTNNLDCEGSLSKSGKREGSKESQQRKRKYGLDYRKMKLRKQNTMLEKLLEPDIRHERNVLLQCVRFVCQNNFFQT